MPKVEGDDSMRNQPAGLQDNTKLNARWNFVGKGAAAVALALCLGSGAYAQQGQQNQNQQDQQQQQDEQMGPQQDQQQGQQGQPSDQQQAPPAQDAKTKPTYAPQDADKPPYSHDQNTPQRPRQPQMNQGRPAPATPSAPSAPNRPYQSQALPDTLTIPAGTILRVRMNDYLSSDKNQIGDRFTAELLQPLVVNGWVVATRGETLVGQVKSAKKAGRVKGTSELDLELTDLSVVDGRQLPILTQLWKGSGGTSHGADAATIAGGTGLGAAIGAAADWGTGAAIGAGAGAVAGIATVLLTRGRPTIVEPEMELTFRLDDPVTVDTTQSQQAFLPVTQRDYQSNGDHRRPRLAEGYPYPYPYYPYGYYGPYWYPGFVGIYGGGWWGPRYYGGWRGGFHR
jgi:hypothetical protein